MVYLGYGLLVDGLPWLRIVTIDNLVKSFLLEEASKEPKIKFNHLL